MRCSLVYNATKCISRSVYETILLGPRNMYLKVKKTRCHALTSTSEHLLAAITVLSRREKRYFFGKISKLKLLKEVLSCDFITDKIWILVSQRFLPVYSC